MVLRDNKSSKNSENIILWTKCPHYTEEVRTAIPRYKNRAPKNKMKLLKKLKLLFSPSYIKSGVLGDIGSKGDSKVEDSRLSVNLSKLVKDEGIPVKLLPNVRNFIIKINNLDWLFGVFGIDKKLSPKMEFSPWRNRRINRYVVWQFQRLAKARNNPHLFFKIAWSLMRSRSYMLIGLHSVCFGWHRNMPYKEVVRLCRQVEQLIKKRNVRLDFKRVYIDKADGTPRPLGVPSLPWRVYLHMYTNLLSWYLKPQIPLGQHAYQRGKGVMSAWREIAEKVLKSNNIYEFDLKDFFGSVNQQYLEMLMMSDLRMPVSEMYFIKRLMRNLPKLPEKKRMYEGFAQMPGMAGYSDWDQIMSAAQAEIFAEVINQELRPGEWGSVQEMKLSGVPQGAPFSPLLAIQALNFTLFNYRPKYYETLMYADDGVMYGPTSISFQKSTGPWPIYNPDLKESGIKINPDKSGWVKKDGVWLKPLKFLGCEFDGVSGKFTAKTRKGAILEFDTETKFLVWLASNCSKLGTNYTKGMRDSPAFAKSMTSWWDLFKVADTNWDQLFKSRYFGFILSRIWQNNWNLTQRQDFNLKFITGSWMDVKAARFIKREKISEMLTVFNSSSFAPTFLLDDLRKRTKYNEKKSWLLGLEFGTIQALVKIRRIFTKNVVGPRIRKPLKE